VSYTTSSWTTVADIVWSNAITVVGNETEDGYSISASYSTTYFDVTVTTYSSSDAVQLENYVGGNTYKTNLNALVKSYITAGSLSVTTQPITSATNNGNAYTSSSSQSSGGSKTAWWVWVAAILIGLLVGLGFGFSMAYCRHKQDEKKSTKLCQNGGLCCTIKMVNILLEHVQLFFLLFFLSLFFVFLSLLRQTVLLLTRGNIDFVLS